jgi:hypothetical protein
VVWEKIQWYGTRYSGMGKGKSTTCLYCLSLGVCVCAFVLHCSKWEPHKTTAVSRAQCERAAVSEVKGPRECEEIEAPYP